MKQLPSCSDRRRLVQWWLSAPLSGKTADWERRFCLHLPCRAREASHFSAAPNSEGDMEGETMPLRYRSGTPLRERFCRQLTCLFARAPEANYLPDHTT